MLAASALVVSLIAGCAGGGDRGTAPPRMPAELPRFGFSDDAATFPYEGAPDPEAFAELQAGAGAGIARLTVLWNTVEPEPPRRDGRHHYRWEAYDRVIAALAQRGIRPLLLVTAAPGWARAAADGCGGIHCPPVGAHRDSWRRFILKLAKRYPEAVAIEVWNEPNLRFFWDTRKGPNPERYARLLVDAHRAVERAGTKTRLLVGGLAQAGRPAGPDGFRVPGIRIRRFLVRMYAELGDRRLPRSTRIALHAYPDRRAAVEGLRPQGRFRRTLREYTRARNRLDRPRRFWVTEFGASTTMPDLDGGEETDERRQAELIAEMARRLGARRDIEALILHKLVDHPGAGGGEAEVGFGVVEADGEGTPKLAWCMLVEAAGNPGPDACARVAD